MTKKATDTTNELNALSGGLGESQRVVEQLQRAIRGPVSPPDMNDPDVRAALTKAVDEMRALDEAFEKLIRTLQWNVTDHKDARG